MKDKLKTHIGAAQNWLSDAAGAIEREEKARGAIDIMLAEAEIARVKEINGGKKWYELPKKILPLAAVFIAALLAVGILKTLDIDPLSRGAKLSAAVSGGAAINKPIAPQKPEIEKPKVASPTVEPPAKVEKQDGSDNATKPRQPNIAEEINKPKPPKPQPPDVSPKKNLPIEPPRFSPHGDNVKNAAAPNVPDKNLQKLMLDAGRILRKSE